MSTDDRDIDSGNPSKSFNVGEFDRLSGFFTPVWESKRRLRAESPLAGSSAATGAGAGAPSERGPASPAVSAPDREGSSAGADSAAAEERATPAPARAQAAVSTAGDAPSAPAAPVPLTLRDAALTRLNPTGTLRGVAAPGAAATRAPGSSPAAAARESSAPGSTPAPGSERSGERPSRPQPVAAALAAAAAVTVRPVIPMPQTPGRVPVRSKAPAPQGPAPVDRRAPSPPEESHPEQEARPSSPAPSAPRGRSWAQRSERAAAAARAVHHALETRRSSEPSDETFRRHRETESEREASLFAAAQAANAPVDAHPSHVLRTLRRTFHLSTPLPEPVQRMLDEHRR